MPSLMSVVLINNAADELALISSTIGRGTYKFPPPASVARYDARGTFNYGFALQAPFPTGGPMNTTVLYRSPVAGGPFAVIVLFSVPGEFGVEVNTVTCLRYPLPNAHHAHVRVHEHRNKHAHA